MGWSLIPIIKIPLLATFGGYVVLISILSVFQSSLVYFPSSKMELNPEVLGLKYEAVKFNSSDNTKLYGWYIPSKDSNTTLLYAHGNGGNISHRLDSINIFNSLGVNVFIFDYRGYGYSEGSATEENTYDDAMQAWNYLIENKNTKEEDIIIFGRSLGGAVAANLASKVNPKALILESTFTTIKDMASDVYPFMPSSLITFKYETIEYIKEIDTPVLVVHSENDNIIPFKHGVSVFETAKEPKRFVKIRGSHNYGFLESKEDYIKGLRNFFIEIKI